MHDAHTGIAVAPPLERARELYLRARLDEALSLLSGCEDWPETTCENALALRAEILTVRDPVAGLQELASCRDAFTTPQGKLDYAVASARAYTNSRNFDAARIMLAAAQELLDGPNDPRAPRVAYQRARLDVITRQCDPATRDFAIALLDEDPALRFSALSWRSWMHAACEDHRAQLTDLREAIRLFEREGYRCNLHAVAVSLHALLRLAFELGETQAVDAGELAFDAIDWTPEIANYRFLCLRALAWDAFLRGQPARAQWLFKDSKDAAPTPAWKVMAHVDRAYVARMNDNEAWALEELERAHHLAQHVTWSSTKGEERSALVTLAILYAPVNMARAQGYVSTYVSIGRENLDPTLTAVADRRAVGFEKYAMGCVQRVIGDTTLAISSFGNAFEIFAQTEHYYRAALSAFALHEITKDAAWLEIARANASRFPHSAIHRKLHAAEDLREDPLLERLSPMQRQIAAAVAEGLDVSQLSVRFSRSTFTIEKQLDGILSQLSLPSCFALRTALRRNGIT